MVKVVTATAAVAAARVNLTTSTALVTTLMAAVITF